MKQGQVQRSGSAQKAMPKTSNLGSAFASALVFVLGLPVFGVFIFSLLSHLFTCPADRPACDLPGMAAFGLACVLSPVFSAIVAVLVFRHILRGNGAQRASIDPPD